MPRSEKRRKDERLSIRVTAETKADMEKMAADSGKSFSATVHSAMELYRQYLEACAAGGGVRIIHPGREPRPVYFLD